MDAALGERGLALAVEDKQAVAVHRIPPLLMEWMTSVPRLFLLLPLALRNWSDVVADWRMRRKYALWIGALTPLSYLLILIAMTFPPGSYIAPAREVSILFGALLGGHLLGEGDRGRRTIAATVMVIGIILLSVP
jgi:drug/metabolite transporter (DMT)-like permease